jgi:hypothetical protein
MATVTIDNQSYDLDSLSAEAKVQLANLQFCDAELQRLQALTAVVQTARRSYARGLNMALTGLAGDTMKLN